MPLTTSTASGGFRLSRRLFTPQFLPYVVLEPVSLTASIASRVMHSLQPCYHCWVGFGRCWKAGSLTTSTASRVFCVPRPCQDWKLGFGLEQDLGFFFGATLAPKKKPKTADRLLSGFQARCQPCQLGFKFSWTLATQYLHAKSPFGLFWHPFTTVTSLRVWAVLGP